MRISALDAHALAISSTAICSISVPVPVPPCSSSKGSPRMSCSAKQPADVPRVLAGGVDLGGARRDALAHDLADRVAEVPVLLRDLVDVGRRERPSRAMVMGVCRAAGRGSPRRMSHRRLPVHDRRRRDPPLRRLGQHRGRSTCRSSALILMIVGVIGLLISLFMYANATRRADGRRARPLRGPRPAARSPARPPRRRPPARGAGAAGSSGSAVPLRDVAAARRGSRRARGARRRCRSRRRAGAPGRRRRSCSAPAPPAPAILRAARQRLVDRDPLELAVHPEHRRAVLEAAGEREEARGAARVAAAQRGQPAADDAHGGRVGRAGGHAGAPAAGAPADRPAARRARAGACVGRRCVRGARRRRRPRARAERGGRRGARRRRAATA